MARGKVNSQSEKSKKVPQIAEIEIDKISEELEEAIRLIRALISHMRRNAENWTGPGAYVSGGVGKGRRDYGPRSRRAAWRATGLYWHVRGLAEVDRWVRIKRWAGAAYLSSDWVDYRRKMMQWFADWLDAEREQHAEPELPDNVVVFRRAA